MSEQTPAPPTTRLTPTQLTPAKLLLVIDMQCGLFDGGRAIPGASGLRKSVTTLVERARENRVPVVFLQNDGPVGSDDEPGSLGWQLTIPVAPGEVVLRKSDDNGFIDTALSEILARHHVESLAVVGAVSEMCVAATVREALRRGFDVVLPHDGHGTYDVPPGPGGSPAVPANFAARAAEWSLGDEVTVVPSVHDVVFAG